MEPERPIEKLLRAWAKKRREDASGGFELHPADRRLLQSEIAKQFRTRQKPPHTFRDRLASLWPTVAVGATVIGALAVLSILFLPGRRGTRDQAKFGETQNRMAWRTEPQIRSLPAAAPAKDSEAVTRASRPQPSSGAGTNAGETPELAGGTRAPLNSTGQLAFAYADRSQNQSAEDKLGLRAAQSDNSRRGSASPDQVLALGSTTSTLTVSGAAPTHGQNSSLAGSAASVSPAAATNRIHFDGDYVVANAPSSGTDSLLRMNQSAPALTMARAATPSVALMESAKGSITNDLSDARTIQRFFYVPQQESIDPKNKAQLARIQLVLRAFELQQTGQELRILDADGSVYTGSVQPAEAAAERDLAKVGGYALAPSAVPTRKKNDSLPSGAENQIYSFRVAGTNRTLNQELVFTGTLFRATNGVPRQITAGPAAANQTARAKAGSVQPAATRISGKAIVGGTNQVEVNAVVAP